MSFAALPPEINSGLMYTGPGAGSILAAATAWDGLAAELRATAAAYDSVVQGLTGGPWLGASSAAMAAAAAPHIGWLNATAAQAEQTAAQAKAAAADYEAAFAMTVPPSVIAANRAQLMLLVATNVLGQNAPAIAANEAQYGGFWVQDAAAMDGYASSAATVADVAPFAPPRPDTSSGPAGQSGADAQAAGNSAGTVAQNALGHAGSATSTAQQGSASPSLATQASLQAAPLQATPAEDAVPEATLADVLAGIGLGLAGAAWSEAHGNGEYLVDLDDRLLSGQAEILGAIDPSRLLSSIGSAGVGAAPVSANLGQAATVGSLSVPSSWTVAAPEIRTAAYALPAAAAAPAGVAGLGTAFSQMALAGMGGSALAGSVKPGRGGADSGTRVRPLRQPAASPASPPDAPQPPHAPVTSVAAEIREFAELRDAGILTNEEFQEQKRRLLGR